MTEPTTSNIGLIIPNTGDLPGTWGSAAINPDMTAIDGMFGGVATVSLTNTNVTLTSPSATISPTAGPNQSQNAIIVLNGTLTGNVQITMPLPGIQRFYNATTGNFVVTLAAASAGNVVGIPQGVMTEVFNDGTNVYFCNLGGYPGKMEFMGGVSVVPAWITACTVKPYLLADTTIYNASGYPILFGLYGGKFGGNGISTFGVPDMSGRVPLQYDFTGTRITTAGCGIDGQTIGAAGGGQNATLLTANLPPYTPAGTLNITATAHVPLQLGGQASSGSSGQTANSASTPVIFDSIGGTLNGTPQGGTSTPVNTVQPAQVAGIWLIKT